VLHVLDHTRYWQSLRHDYVILPPRARTANTRLRWWQRLPTPLLLWTTHSASERRLGWSLDNVLVGGMEIAPSSLWETFDQSLDETVWEFHPGGTLVDGVCGSRTGPVMAWTSGHGGGSGLGSGVNMITTSQLIVQQNYIIQFKVTGRQC